MSDIILAQEAERNSKRPKGAGPSTAGEECERRLSFLLRDVPHSNPVDQGAAIVGTLLHEAWQARMLRARPWAEAEVPLTIPHLDYQGHADLVDFDAMEIWDLKTVNARRFDSWLALDSPPGYVWDQLAMYGAAVVRFPDQREPWDGKPLPEDWTLIVEAVDREHGRWHTWSRPYDDAVGMETCRWMSERNTRLAAIPPEEVAPNPSPLCGWCPWRVTCFGPSTEQPIPRITENVDSLEIIDAAAEYLGLGEIIRTAEQQREAAKGRMGDAEGDFGDYRLSVQYRRGVDWSAVRKIVADAGQELPMKPEPTRVRIVKRIEG